VKDAEPAKWTKRSNLPEVTKSWHDYMTKEVVQDFQSAILQVSDSPYDEEYVSNIPQVAYEFPNGYRNEFGLERFKISEALFDPHKIRVPNANTMLSVAHVLTTSVGKYPKSQQFF
jgi:actin-related protein